jgi:hypothetical protein
MRTNRDDVTRGAGECYRSHGMPGPCRTCGKRVAPLHIPAGEKGGYCPNCCPSCTVSPAIDVEALAGVVELVD